MGNIGLNVATSQLEWWGMRSPHLHAIEEANIRVVVGATAQPPGETVMVCLWVTCFHVGERKGYLITGFNRYRDSYKA